jgi:hypothetical protein
LGEAFSVKDGNFAEHIFVKYPKKIKKIKAKMAFDK